MSSSACFVFSCIVVLSTLIVSHFAAGTTSSSSVSTDCVVFSFETLKLSSGKATIVADGSSGGEDGVSVSGLVWMLSPLMESFMQFSSFDVSVSSVAPPSISLLETIEGRDSTAFGLSSLASSESALEFIISTVFKCDESS